MARQQEEEQQPAARQQVALRLAARKRQVEPHSARRAEQVQAARRQVAQLWAARRRVERQQEARQQAAWASLESPLARCASKSRAPPGQKFVSTHEDGPPFLQHTYPR